MGVVTDELSSLVKLDIQRKAVLVTLLITLFVIGILISAIIFRKEPVVVPKGSANPPVYTVTGAVSPVVKKTATVSLVSATQTVRVGESTNLSVVLSGEGIQVYDVVLTYDPVVFRAEDIEFDPQFPQHLQQSIESGKISVSAAVGAQKPPKSATGKLFSLTLTALSPSSGSKVAVAALESQVAKAGENVLGETKDVMFTVLK